MLHVLRHYLPLRKALLIASETVWLTLVVAAGMSAHLFGELSPGVQRAVASEGFTLEGAQLRVLFTSFLVSLLAQVALYFNELYEFQATSSRGERFARFVGSAGLAICFALVAIGLSHLWGFERVLDFPGLTLSQTAQTLVFSLLVGFVFLYGWRWVFQRLLRVWRLGERVLVIGSGEMARALIRELGARPEAGYEIVGVLPTASLPPTGRRATDREDALGGSARYGTAGGTSRRGPRPLHAEGGPVAVAQAGEPRAADGDAPELRDLGAPVVGRVSGESLHALARRLRIDDVVVAVEDRRGTMPLEELLRCRLAGIVVEEGEALYERVTGKIAVEALRPSYLIFNQGFVQHPFSGVSKRAFDVLCAVVGIFLTWPLMLLTAIAVRMDSPGPVLYRQERYGRFGEPIVVNKFRSMYVDAESRTGPVWASQDDPRVTPVGRFIRKTRLDELPQLFNVLGGSMSMVGPRPERPVFVEELAQQIPYYHQRHIVKPGVTGWAQINYPYGNTVEDAVQKLQYDLFYIKYHSLPFDLSIVVNTLKTVLLRKGT